MCVCRAGGKGRGGGVHSRPESQQRQQQHTEADSTHTPCCCCWKDTHSQYRYWVCYYSRPPGVQVYAELTICTLLLAAGMFPHVPLMNGLMGASPHVVGGHGHAPGQAPPSQGPAGGDGSSGGEQDALSTAQRSMLKWEKEEVLGEMATVAPVLYCNTNFPQLREQFPGKSNRSSRHKLSCARASCLKAGSVE